MSTTPYDPRSKDSRDALATRLLATITGAGFVEEDVRKVGIRERVFYRTVHATPSCRVQVYTSLTGFDSAASARAAGVDAIRVVAVFRDAEKKDHPVATTVRVHRVGSIEDICARTLGRMRKAYLDTCNVPRCARCGAPTFKSKKQNRVCGNFCWKRAS